MNDPKKAKELAQLIFQSEATAIANLEKQINDQFLLACQWIADCTGHIVLMGVGKSGHISGKIAATMSSTGNSAFFLHPTEANHGDFGMIKPNDVAVLLSHSGESEELNQLLPALRTLGVKTIAITAKPDSILGKMCNICLNTAITDEACPMGLAPTTSTAATLAMGDALALIAAQINGFTAEDFARLHPGGRLGRSLTLKIKDIMHTGEKIPLVTEDTLLSNALYEISRKRLGMTLICQGTALDTSKVTGIFTDGDLRRALDKGLDIQKIKIAEVMSRNFRSVDPETPAVVALDLCEKYAISGMPVIDHETKLVGALNFHDLLNAKIKS